MQEERQSLVDQALDAIASVRAMSEGMDLEHPQRNIVRDLQRLAERSIAQALEQAKRLAQSAKELRSMPQGDPASKKGE